MMLALRGQEEGDTLQDWQRYTRGETGLLAMPCFHVGGTSFGLSIIHSGAQVVVLAEYDPSETLKLIESYKIAKIFVVPSTLQMLLKDPQFDKTDFSNLQFIFYGASPIPLELMREATKKIGCGFVQMYGMTETGGTIVALSPEDHLPDSEDETEIQRMRSVGIGMSGVELKIINQQGRNLPNGEIGEIATRSVKNIKAYWNLPEATKSTIDDDGWLRTGDAGYLDDDGYLYMHDRVKDMIISGGENVYPAEVEDAVYSHPAVEDVAVIGVPDDKWGEAIKAFVVVKDDVEVSADDIIRFARTRIAKFKCPKTIDFIDTLPRNPSGKILRRELREPYWKDKTRAVN
jgi:acyl-CoA synthetase (AMP-forming)/AMP-acid ligase II